ncbi:MAG: CRISPR-associated endonuclease Cas3'', partial [Candidatus Caldatribacteriaceae bacterium]
MSIVWAKSTGISLCKHVTDLVQVLEDLEKFLEKYPFWQEFQLQALLRDAVFCHDFGKVQPAFQIKLGNKGYHPNFFSEIPHSLASLFFLNWETLNERIGKERIPFFLSAVAFHHFRGDFLEYLGAENARLRQFCLRLLEDKIWREKLLENLSCTLSNCQGLQELLGFNEKFARAIVNGLSLSDFVLLPYLLEGFPLRIAFPKERERFFILLSGFLKRCDHFASFCEGEDQYFPPEREGLAKEKLWRMLTEKLKEQIRTETLWQEEYLQGW